MSRTCVHPVLTAAACLAGAFPVWGQTSRSWTDAVGDAAVRRTDTGANGPLPASGVLPDVVHVTLGGWQPTSPASDPYTGSYVPPASARIFRLDVVFKGLVNPPGTLGLGGQAFDPTKFGPSPLHGFIEFDVDDEKNTGGEIDQSARNRYLGNVARFGRRPTGAIGDRAAASAWEYDTNFASTPFYERSGGEFTLAMCGCHATTIIAKLSGDGDDLFESGEAWIVRSRYFRRNGGFACKSNVFGGSAVKEYDPELSYRFAHSTGTNETTVTLVYALDMTGAGQLLGLGSPPPVNANAGDATSILEALTDIVNNAPTATGNCDILIGGWEGRNPADYLDVTKWDVRGIVGTTYTNTEDSVYVWTDTGFTETPGDMNADGLSTLADRQAILAGITGLDGTGFDEDGTANGVVDIIDFGPNFHLLDADGDGFIRSLDVSLLCPADFNGDGQLSVADFGAFQTAYQFGDMRSDFNHDGQLTIADFSAFQTTYVLGCP
ncbi:MAG: GC-type dockerin domain-anchored protein [Phycisphaerales bacterium]